MKTLQEIRTNSGFLIRSTSADGGCGELYRSGKPFASVIWSNGGGWEHVSIAPYKRSYLPTWNDMCALKDMFFYENETVVQFHPPKSEYVNNLSNCLHLWRPTDSELPLPPSIFVGIKSGMSQSDVLKEMRKFL